MQAFGRNVTCATERLGSLLRLYRSGTKGALALIGREIGERLRNDLAGVWFFWRSFHVTFPLATKQRPQTHVPRSQLRWVSRWLGILAAAGKDFCDLARVSRFPKRAEIYTD